MGAVLSAFQTPLGASDWLNVLSFGATGNGSSDDTAAIQAAIAAVHSNGGTVYFPAGTYKITSTLNATINGTILQGDGWGAQIQYDGSVATTAIAATGNIRLFVRDLRISQTNASHVGTAIDLSNTNRSVVEKVLIDAGGASGVAPNIGVQLNAATCHYNSVKDCRISYGGTSARGVSIIGGSHSNTVQDVRLVPSGDDVNSAGVYIANTHSTTLIHPDIEGATGNGIWLDTAANGTTILNAYCEANNIGLKITSGVVAPVVTGGTFQSSVTSNIQDNGSVSPFTVNAWPNSGSSSFSHLALTGADTASINGVTIPSGVVQPDGLGFLAWTYQPDGTTNTTLTVSGTLYLAQITLRYAKTISKLAIGITTAAATVTANQNFLGLYDSNGTLQASTAAGTLDTLITSTGLVNASVATPFAAPAGTYWVAFVNNATTPATLARASGASLTIANGGAAASAYRYAVNGTALTALPATITPASNTLAGAFTMWAAVS